MHFCTLLSAFNIALGESLPVALLRVRARALRVNHGEHGVPLGSHGVSDCVEMYQNGQGENVAFFWYQICRGARPGDSQPLIIA